MFWMRSGYLTYVRILRGMTLPVHIANYVERLHNSRRHIAKFGHGVDAFRSLPHNHLCRRES